MPTKARATPELSHGSKVSAAKWKKGEKSTRDDNTQKSWGSTLEMDSETGAERPMAPKKVMKRFWIRANTSKATVAMVPSAMRESKRR